MQHGPGTENAFGGVAQAYGDSVRSWCCRPAMPATSTRSTRISAPRSNFRHVTKWCEQVTVADATVEALRRAFTPVQKRPPRPGAGRDSRPTSCARRCPTRWSTIHAGAAAAERPRPAIGVEDRRGAGRGASGRSSTPGRACTTRKAWPQLKALAELLEAPVTTSLPGKSAFPENHPLSLGSGGIGIGEHLWHLPAERRLHLRHRLQLHPHQLRHADAEGQEDRPRDARPDATSTRTCRSIWRRSATPG